MSETKNFLEKLRITPDLREFLRDELAEVLSYEGPAGETWNPLSIEAQINSSDSIPGAASDDAIRRFVEGNGERTKRRALIAIAGFMMEFEYVTKEDLEQFSRPGYSRAASALAQLYASLPIEEAEALVKSLAGEYRDYRFAGRNWLLATTMVLASPNTGRALTVTERREIFRLQEPDWFIEETEDLDPTCFGLIPQLLQEPEGEVFGRTEGRGVGVITPSLGYLAIGGDQRLAHAVVTFTELHRIGDDVCGIRAQRSRDWMAVNDGAPVRRRETAISALLGKASGNLELYPQGIAVQSMPEFASKPTGTLDGGERRGRLGFLSAAQGTVKTKDDLIIEAAALDDDIEAVMLECADATERLMAAMELFRPDHALSALDEGAEVNALHDGYDLPMIHAAAALGMRQVVRAMIATGRCDLTVRDRFGRLASSCAGMCAGDLILRDELIAAQTAQFRARGIDPRRPTVPGYGSYILGPEPG